jgi:hypothetical protein
MVRRTKEQLAHTFDNLLTNHFGVTFEIRRRLAVQS